MSVPASRAKLAAAHRALAAAWDEVTASWDDPASRAFWMNHVEPIEKSVRSAYASLDHIAGVLERVRRDCGDDAP
jgi:hypothetical protein